MRPPNVDTNPNPTFNFTLHSMEGLRVADASVLSVQPRVPTAAACMLVGVHGAVLILDDRAAT